MTREDRIRGASPNAKLVWLVAASFFTFACCVIVRAGLGNTPWDTVDSRGRTMGFNDVFSLEHYTIILSNFSISELFDLEYAVAADASDRGETAVRSRFTTDSPGKSILRRSIGSLPIFDSWFSNGAFPALRHHTA